MMRPVDKHRPTPWQSWANVFLTLGCFVGTLYSEPCMVGMFGSSCDKFCRCKRGVACRKEDGKCPPTVGCVGGWRGPFCNETSCPIGSYGAACKQYCKCKGRTQCDVDIGICPELCEEGWSGPRCDRTGCAPGAMGHNCRAKCPCQIGMPCHALTGECLSVPDHTGTDLPPVISVPKIQVDDECEQPGKWGEQCDKNCMDPNCLHCDKDKGMLCKTPLANTTDIDISGNMTCIQPGKWGEQCDKYCLDPYCLHCDRENGTLCITRAVKSGASNNMDTFLTTSLSVFFIAGRVLLLL